MVDAMYKMILKQLWNERKGNLFIWLEMLVVSIFLWYAADALFVMYRLYSQPLGFNIEHTVSPPACIFITGDRINTPRSGRTR